MKVELYLGIPLTPLLMEHLANADQSLVDVFVREEGDYLQQVSYNETLYLAKKAGETCDLGNLELLQTNIYSLLNKLLPTSACQEIPLELFPLATSS